MAVQPFPYLVMTDGTDTVTFCDGAGGLTNWMPVRGQWGPAIAGIRTSQLGGRGPYADVEEDLSCNIRDTTAALCYTDLDTLTRLLDKAERWWLRNDPISPVLLKYAPQGSTIHNSPAPVMQAVVLGRAGTNELNGVVLPTNANDAGMIFEIDNVKIVCMRRGTWTGASDTTGASGSAANATVLTRAFGTTHPISSPVDVTIAGFDQTATPTIKAGYLIVGSNVNDIQVVEAEGATATAFTSVADAAALARGGSVLRYTPTGTVAATSGTISLTLIGGPIAIIAAVRNNGATTYQIQANLSGFGAADSTPAQLIDATANPRLILLGTVNTVANKLSLTITASAAASSLDIDYLIVVNLRDETVTILAHDDISLANAGAGAASLAFDYNPTSDQNPRVFVAGSGGNVPLTYRGNLPFLTSGINLYALWTATNGTFWRFTNTSNAIVNVTLNVTRYRSYLSPR